MSSKFKFCDACYFGYFGYFGYVAVLSARSSKFKSCDACEAGVTFTSQWHVRHHAVTAACGHRLSQKVQLHNGCSEPRQSCCRAATVAGCRRSDTAASCRRIDVAASCHCIGTAASCCRAVASCHRAAATAGRDEHACRQGIEVDGLSIRGLPEVQLCGSLLRWGLLALG